MFVILFIVLIALPITLIILFVKSAKKIAHNKKYSPVIRTLLITALAALLLWILYRIFFSNQLLFY